MAIKFKKTQILFLQAVGCLALTHAAYAGGMESHSTSSVYASLFSGVNWIKSGRTMSVNFGGLATNRYQSNDNSTKGPLAGIDIGYYWFFPRHELLLSLGAESGYTRSIKNGGLVRPLFFLNSSFPTLNYTYAISSIPLFIVGKFEWRLEKRLWSYFIGGVGVSWNRAQDYNEVPTVPGLTAVPMRAMFRASTKADFAYTAGFGLDVQLTTSISLGAEYRYTDYGTANFNTTVIQATSDKLSLGHVAANALLVRLTVS